MDASIAVVAALGGQGSDQPLAQQLAVGIAEVDMGDRFQVIGEIGVLTTAGVIDQLMGHAKMSGPHGRMNPTHGVDGQDRLCTGLLQGPEIGAIVHLMGREAMRMTMTSQEQDFTPGEFANVHLGGRCAIGCLHRQGLANGQALQLGQAGTADDCVNGHR